MVRICHDADDAEDVLSEALLRAYRFQSSLQDEQAFRSWLAMIGRRVCIRLRQTEAQHPVVKLADDWDVQDTSQPPDELALMQETHQCILSAVNAMPEIYRDVYVRREVREETAEETAAALGVSVAAVKSRLHRARNLMREAMDSQLDTFLPDESNATRAGSH